MRILVVEDDEQVLESIAALLATQNYTVDTARDGLTGWDLVEMFPYDLVVLDVMLPKIDGISFCRRLRAQKVTTPVLLLTARDTAADKILGLDAGADDYAIKPFLPDELAARVRALLRRSNPGVLPILEWGDMALDPLSRQVSYAGQPIKFTPKEFALMELLLRNPKRVFSRAAILDRLWGYDKSPGEDTIKAHVKGMRQKLKTVGAEDVIETLYGQGYRLNPDFLPQNTDTTTRQSPLLPESAEMMAQARQAVAGIWERTKSMSFERLATLERAGVALAGGDLDEDLRRAAERNAHKLHGSLGTFGMADGSQVAAWLEEALAGESPIDRPQVQKIIAQIKALRQEIERGAAASEARSELGDPPPQPPLLLALEGDPLLAEALAQAAGQWGLRLQLTQEASQARHLIAQERPDVLLVDWSLGPAAQELLVELAGVAALPTIVQDDRERFLDRVAAVRLGARAFFSKPTSAHELLQTAARLASLAKRPEATILAVDDDPQTLQVLCAALEPWGLRVETLERPTEFWDCLEATRPDLVILDVEMPEVGGIDLCRALRADDRWSWLPVLFLTARQDDDIRYQAFEVGADDYATKPIAPPELVCRLLNRLERVRLLRGAAETDAATGMLLRERAEQEIDRLLNVARHAREPLCLGVVRFDGLDTLNQRHGHATGEKLLRHLARLLRQKLRPEDVVGRWGGAEFVVGLYGLTQSDGVEWLADVLEVARASAMTAPNGETVAASFSAGVAEFPSDGIDRPTLYTAAAVAMDRAREAGSDRVLPVGWQPRDPDSAIVHVALVHSSPEVAAWVERTLDTRGYHHCWLPDARAALGILGGRRPKLRAAVVLVGQPEDQGLAEWFQSAGNKLRNVAAIALLETDLRPETLLELGARDYVRLPCAPSVLMQQLRKVIGQ